MSTLQPNSDGDIVASLRAQAQPQSESQPTFTPPPSSEATRLTHWRIQPVLLVLVPILVLVSSGLLVQTRGFNPQLWFDAEARCRADTRSYVAAADTLFDQWDDANAVANMTSRIALSPQVARLQEIRRDFAALSAPSCAEKAHNSMLRYMDATIKTYLAFMAQSDTASMHGDVAVKQRAAVKEFVTIGLEPN